MREDLFNLPEGEQHRQPVLSTHKHDRLVAAGSLLTGVTLIGGATIGLYGGWQILFNGVGPVDAVVALVGILLAGTHWGWVQVAEYLGLTIDEHQQPRGGRTREPARGDRAVPSVQRLNQRPRQRFDARHTCSAPARLDPRGCRGNLHAAVGHLEAAARIRSRSFLAPEIFGQAADRQC